MPAIPRHVLRVAAILAALLLFVVSAAQAQGPAQEMLVQAKAELRKERSSASTVVAVLAPGERVLAGFPREGWLAVFRLGGPASDEATALGYLPVGLLGPAPKAPGAGQAAPATSKPAAKPQAQAAQAPENKDGSLLTGQGQGMLNKQDPVRITSDKLIYKQAENAVAFEGNVHATHGGMALWANKITAFFADKKKAKDPGAKDGDLADKIERIVAEGNVRMVAGKNEGFCGKLTYFVAENTLRMDENPILREGTNTVRGEVIKFYVKENRSEVLSGSQRRVEAIFQTPKSDSKPGGR